MSTRADEVGEPITASSLAHWEQSHEDRWWVDAALRAGWKSVGSDRGNEQNDLNDLLFAIEMAGLLTIAELNAFLEEARTWGEDVLAAVQQNVPQMAAYPFDPLTVMFLVHSKAPYEMIAQTGYLPVYRRAIERVVHERDNRPAPYRPAMTGMPLDPLARPSNWTGRMADCGAKLIRAEELTAQLNVDIEYFLQRHPIRLVARPHIVEGDVIANQLIMVAEGVADPPIEWSLRSAEIIYNLRSALDQLVYQLAWDGRSKTGDHSEPKRRTYFPAYENRQAYEEFRRRSKPSQDPLGELAEDSIKMIERFQPFSPVEPWDPPNILPAIFSLSNEDKHRIVRPVLQTPGMLGVFSWRYKGCSSARNIAIWEKSAPLRNGSAILAVIGQDVTNDFDAIVDAYLPVNIMLDDRAPLVEFLADAVAYVSYVIGAFRRVF